MPGTSAAWPGRLRSSGRGPEEPGPTEESPNAARDPAAFLARPGDRANLPFAPPPAEPTPTGFTPTRAAAHL